MQQNAKIAGMNDRPPEDAGFSVIKFFPLFQEAIAKIDQYPLQSENIIVQADAFKRLAAHDEVDEYEPFAILECNRKERDTAMRFALELGAEFFALEIEGIGRTYFAYSDCFANEKDGARQIVACLHMLCSGQITALITFRYGRFCVSEFLLYDSGNRLPHVLTTDGAYAWNWRKSDVVGYEAVVLRNDYLKEQINLPRNSFLYIRTPKGEIPRGGRVFSSPELTPLTKAAYNKAMEDLGMELAGRRQGEADWIFVYRNWEFWVNIACITSLVFIPAFLGLLPGVVLDYPALAILPVSFIASFVTFWELFHKEQLRQHNPDHLWFKFDRWLQRHVFALITTALAGILAAALFLPNMALKTDQTIVTMLQLTSHVPIAYAVPVLCILPLALAWIRTTWATFAALGSIFAAAIMFLVINFGFTDTSDAIQYPEPQASIGIIIVLFALVATPALIIAKAVRLRRNRDKHPN